MVTIPASQLEIRFTNILGFPKNVLPILAPFVKLTTGLKIERENTHDAVIHLQFKETFHTISVRWDKFILKSESHNQNPAANNAFFQEPFLNIFQKIQQIEGFGNINNILYFSIFVNSSPEIEREAHKQIFKKRYLLESVDNIIPEKTDIGITIEKTSPSEDISISMGPYKGVEEIQRHGKGNFTIDDPVTLSNISNPGEMMTITIVKYLTSIALKDYRDLHRQSVEISKNNWKHE